MSFLNFMITPVIGGVIGYVTNWIAIKMLFKPHTEKKIFNIKIPFTPGLIAKERYKLANKVGGTIGEHLLTKETIIKALTSDKFKKDMEKLIDNMYYQFEKSDYTIEQIIEFVLKEDKEKVISQIKELITQNFESMLKNKAQIISDKLCDEIKIFAESHVIEIIDMFIKLLDVEEVYNFLKEAMAKIIKNGLGTIAGIFVNTDKIFDNIMMSTKDFCMNKQNHSIIVEQFNVFIEYLTNKDLSIETIGNVTNVVSENIYNLMDSFLQMNIGTILYEKIEKKTFVKIKNTMLSKYEVFIEFVAPYIITALDIPQIVEDKINDFKVEEAEKIIISVVKKELNAITWFGALLGIIIGLIPMIFK